MNIEFRPIRTPSFIRRNGDPVPSVSPALAMYLRELQASGIEVAPFTVEPDRLDEEVRLREYLASSPMMRADEEGCESPLTPDAVDRLIDELQGEGHESDDEYDSIDPDEIAPFELGDVVRLQSGGPALTVEEVYRCDHCGRWHIDVIWFDHDGRFSEAHGLGFELFELA